MSSMCIHVRAFVRMFWLQKATLVSGHGHVHLTQINTLIWALICVLVQSAGMGQATLLTRMLFLYGTVLVQLLLWHACSRTDCWAILCHGASALQMHMVDDSKVARTGEFIVTSKRVCHATL
jgi:hypothetical protein